MRHRLKIRWAIVAVAVVAGLWYLWPSVRFYSMPTQERQTLKRDDPSGFERLKSAAIKLNRANYRRYLRYIVPRRSEQGWRNIPWRPTYWQGVLEAQRRRKPMLVWAMNGHPLGLT